MKTRSIDIKTTFDVCKGGAFQSRLEEYLREKGVNAVVHTFASQTTTVEEAVKVMGVERGRVMKTIVMMNDLGRPLLAIIPGDKRVDMVKAARQVGVGRVRLADAYEALKHTGYEVGATPLWAIDNRSPFWSMNGS